MIKKKIVYFDMDSVLVNFAGAVEELPVNIRAVYDGRYDEYPGIFSMMKPNREMVDFYNALSVDERFDVYVLSTSPWENPTAASEKIEWIKKYLPNAYKRVILSHNKHLNIGDYLIDDRTHNGAGDFVGKHIHYLTEEFPNVDSIKNYIYNSL